MSCTFSSSSEGVPTAKEKCNHSDDKHHRYKTDNGKYHVWCTSCPSGTVCATDVTSNKVSKLTDKKAP